MTLSPNDAAQALHEIEQVRTRSAELFNYSKAAPHLILWGCIWVIGYGLSDLFPERANLAWAILTVAGIVIGLLFTRGDPPFYARRQGAIALTMFAFFVASFSVLGPVGHKQASAFIPLVLATIYIVMGLWLGKRIVVAGVALGVLTLTGYFLLNAYFLLWMAAVGGGVLILSGLWLRRA